MHVDGGVAAPLFVVPEALLKWAKLGERLQTSRVYIIVNMSLQRAPQTIEPNVVAILSRSFDTMLRASYRQALSVVTTFCADHSLPLWVAAIPTEPSGGSMLSFDTTVMRAIFHAAVERAQDPAFWHAAGAPAPESRR
jgi:hypothetical protein